MIAGLILFLGVHSIRIFAEGWRTRMIDRIGAGRWKGLYTFNSVIGLLLIIWGYGLARDYPVPVWDPPVWASHLTIVLMAPAFFLVAQNGNPQGPIAARLGHPMMIAVIIWALAHLLANGTLADIVLFGTFLVWSVFALRAAVHRDRAAGTERVAGGWMKDILPGSAGLVLWLVFLLKAHQWLFGVSPVA